MSFIVCRNCKRVMKVDETKPLNFDKCANCGHTLEFASDETELKMMLNGIVIPNISYHKICTSCNSLNPRETGACLHCGSTNLQLQYDLDSLKQNENVVIEGNPNPNAGIRTIVINAGSNFSPKNNLIFRIFSLIIGLVDFFFFSLLGFQLIIGSGELPTDAMAFATQNIVPLISVIIISLVLAGLMSVMIIPRMSYRDSLETSSTIGLAVGLVTLIVTKDIITVVASILVCSIFSGIGGLIGEYIIHRLTRKS